MPVSALRRGAAALFASTLTGVGLVALGATPASADDTPAVQVSQVAANTYEFSLTVAGAGVTVDYTLDNTGALTSAATAAASATSATITTADNVITVTFPAGQVAKVELGDGNTSVDEVAVSPSETPTPEATDTPEAGDSPDPTESATPEATATASSEGDNAQGDNAQGDEQGSATPAPTATSDSASATPASTSTSSGEGDSGSGGSGSGSGD